jgi:hypothetical protein
MKKCFGSDISHKIQVAQHLEELAFREYVKHL